MTTAKTRFLTAGILVAAALDASGCRSTALELSLQPRISVDEKNAPKDAKWAESCPQAVRVSDEPDYHLFMVWSEESKHWLGNVLRRDGGPALITSQSHPDYKRLLREVCSAIQRDFPSWLRTERERLNISEARRRIDDASNRYSLKDYRHGNILGLALVDQQTGRVWVLTSMLGGKGEKARNEFREMAVEGLWGEDDFLLEQGLATHSQEMKKLYMGMYSRRQISDLQTKEATLPWGVKKARQQAAKSSQ